MIEGVSDELQGLLNIAAELSTRMGHFYVGVEHVFLACAKLDQEALAQALKAGGVSLDPVVKKLLDLMAEAPNLSTDGKILITPRLGEMLDTLRGLGEATPARLLPLLLREGRSLPCGVIRDLGGDLEQIAAALAVAPVGGSEEAQQQMAQARMPALSAMGRDLTQLAAEGRLDPVIGRDAEIRQLALVLARKTKNNPVLIGDAGVGKTAIVEGLALQIASGRVPPSLSNKRIIELPLSMLVAGTQYRGQFEERLMKVVEEVHQNPETILFLDELHTVVGAGSAGSGSLDAANILKPALARGDLRCVGATTLEEYTRHVEPDAALERRFSPVIVRELSLEATRAVLEGRREGYEKHHGVTVTPEAIDAAVRLAARHVPERHMPDKALDLLDEACARASMARYVDEGQQGWRAEAKEPDAVPKVTAGDVAGVLADRTGMAIEHLLQADASALGSLKPLLEAEAIGQSAAAAQVAAALQRHRGTGTAAEARPVSLILAGPPGTGKRAIAQALAQALFHEDALVAFDLADFCEKIDVEKLLGAPPGYIGHDRESLLSRRLRRDPYVVVTLEHFGAASAEVQDLFLRGLATGTINDNQGRSIHLENAVVILLLDLDTGDDAARRPLGFATGDRAAAGLDPEQVRAQVRTALGRDVVDAVHEVVFFTPLDLAALTALAQRGLDRLTTASGPVVFDTAVTEWLAAEALRAGTGRRALERLVRDQVGAPVRDALASGGPRPGEVLYGDVANGKLVLRREPRANPA